MRHSVALLITATLIASACGGPAEDENAARDTAQADRVAGAEAPSSPGAQAGGGVDDTPADDAGAPHEDAGAPTDAASADPDNPPVDAPVDDRSGIATIPARFHGEWNADRDACGTGQSETRLRIRADRVRFYESVGVVQAVDVESERVITVTAQYQGEGDTWEDARQLRLSADGSSLTVSGGGDLVRYRCS